MGEVAGVPNNTIAQLINKIPNCRADPDFSMTNCQAQPRYVHTTYRLPNDGVVTAESARALPGKTVMFNDESRYILRDKNTGFGSNHMQMRNDKNLRKKLDGLYDGDYGRFFQIKRQ